MDGVIDGDGPVNDIEGVGGVSVGNDGVGVALPAD